MPEKGAFSLYQLYSVYRNQPEVELCILDESIIQKNLYPLTDLLIEFIQLIVRQIVPTMFLDAERQQMTQLLSVFSRHLTLGSINEIIVYTRHERTDVSLQQLFFRPVFIASIIEECIAMETGRKKSTLQLCWQ